MSYISYYTSPYHNMCIQTPLNHWCQNKLATNMKNTKHASHKHTHDTLEPTAKMANADFNGFSNTIQILNPPNGGLAFGFPLNHMPRFPKWMPSQDQHSSPFEDLPVVVRDLASVHLGPFLHLLARLSAHRSAISSIHPTTWAGTNHQYPNPNQPFCRVVYVLQGKRKTHSSWGRVLAVVHSFCRSLRVVVVSRLLLVDLRREESLNKFVGSDFGPKVRSWRKQV